MRSSGIAAVQQVALTTWDWATLLQRVWGVDARTCEGCGGRMKFIAVSLRGVREGAFEACMRSWVQSLALPLNGEVVAFVGKALRGAIARAFGRTALHQVHAWAGAQGLLLAQAAVKGAPEEGEAIRTLLEALDLEEDIVTTDAGNATHATIAAVVEARADYVVTVKANRKALHDATRAAFDDEELAATNAKTVFHQTAEQGHGRAEVRQVWAAPASRLGDLAGHWPGLRSIVRIDRTRVLGDGTVEQRTHYFGSSLPPRVRRLGEVIREHWGVENGLHGSLDVQMGGGPMHDPRHAGSDQLRARPQDRAHAPQARRGEEEARGQSEAEGSRGGITSTCSICSCAESHESRRIWRRRPTAAGVAYGAKPTR